MEFSGQYLTYDEYRLLGGTLDIMPFNLLEFEARKIIDSRTQRRLVGKKEIPQSVKMCINKMITSLNSYASSIAKSNNGVASETVGSYSISYASSGMIQEIIKSKQDELEDIVFDYLGDSGLLYLGVC